MNTSGIQNLGQGELILPSDWSDGSILSPDCFRWLNTWYSLLIGLMNKYSDLIGQMNKYSLLIGPLNKYKYSLLIGHMNKYSLPICQINKNASQSDFTQYCILIGKMTQYSIFPDWSYDWILPSDWSDDSVLIGPHLDALLGWRVKYLPTESSLSRYWGLGITRGSCAYYMIHQTAETYCLSRWLIALLCHRESIPKEICKQYQIMLALILPFYYPC